MKVLFVCTGNICRSPTAEGVLRRLAELEKMNIHVESRGTHDYHVGDPPDDRAQDHAKRRGYDLSAQRAKQVGKRDFEARSLLENYAAVIEELIRAKPSAAKGRYLQSVVITSSMSPGVKVDPTRTRDIVEEPAREVGTPRTGNVAGCRADVHGEQAAKVTGADTQARCEVVFGRAVERAVAQLETEQAVAFGVAAQGLLMLSGLAFVLALGAWHAQGRLQQVAVPGQFRRTRTVG